MLILMHRNQRQQPHCLTSLVPEEQGPLDQSALSSGPDLELCKAFGDIRHSQGLPAVLIVGFVVSERLFGPSFTRNVGRPHFSRSIAREMDGDVRITHSCFTRR